MSEIHLTLKVYNAIFVLICGSYIIPFGYVVILLCSKIEPMRNSSPITKGFIPSVLFVGIIRPVFVWLIIGF